MCRATIIKTLFAALSLGLVSAAETVFLCEVHYDNFGPDAGEAVEICGTSGVDMSDWRVVFYTGNSSSSGGRQYGSMNLSGTIDDEGNGYGALGFVRSVIQHGSNDVIGLVLVNANSEVVQFLSYNGTMTATDGIATGLTSTDAGVSESSLTPIGTSLQLTGSGIAYEDFVWQAGITASFGSINANMSFENSSSSISSSGSSSPVTSSAYSSSSHTSSSWLCDQTATLIADVQGSGTVTPYEDTEVTVRGIVTAVFPGLNGFYIQDDGDGSTDTSDGIFIGLPDPTAMCVGDEVVIRGTASEDNNQTKITPTLNPDVCSPGNSLPTPISVVLPSNEAELEALEGMLVSIRNPVVTDNYNADSYGEVTVAAERRWQYTQINPPGTVPEVPVGTTLVIDDGSNDYEPNPDVYVDQASDVRVGQTLKDIKGIIAYNLSEYRLQPMTPGVTLAKATNPRPKSIPKRRRANARIANFNVLNFFTTLGSRGAETEEQREDQLEKITAGVVALNADVIGIEEVENDYDADTPTIEALVDYINAQDSKGKWSYVVPDAASIPLGFDLIAVGLIYDANVVSLKGVSDVFDFEDDKTRASLAQTFSINCGAPRCPSFTVVVSHLASKGVYCDDIGDPDTDDGQGNCSLTRLRGMKNLTEWVTGPDFAVDPDDDIVLVGDFNAYAMEDSIQAAITGGYMNMATFDPSFPCVSSYVFNGESGTLDYIFASATAAFQRIGKLVHHEVNAVEPVGLEYDRCDTNDACTVNLDQYRSSDHDMVAQDFNFVT
ncbi:unnamed protein product [Ascophyllum nodosum]